MLPQHLNTCDNIPEPMRECRPKTFPDPAPDWERLLRSDMSLRSDQTVM